MLTRRLLIASAASSLAPNLFVRAARAQNPKGDFPNKPVRLIVPVAAGGPTDIVARMLAEKLSKMWGQQVVIENKGGAGTNIGNEYVAQSDPDGYTVLFATASLGTGSAPFLAEMLFLQMADLKMTHVPYRGASPAFTDLIPGRIDCYFGSGTLLSYARSGQVRVLATTGAKRDAAAPDVPTIAEAGVRGYDVTAWQALFVPDKTPPAIVRKISVDTNAALADPAIKDKLAQAGYVAEGSSPEELEQLLKSDIAKWSAVIKSMGIKID